MRISDWSSDVCSSDLVALHNRQALCDRLGDIGAFDLDPARADLLGIAQRRHQRAVAATDVEHPRTDGHIGGDDRKIWTKIVETARQHSIALRNPSITRFISGASRRNESWPNGHSRSTKQ